MAGGEEYGEGHLQVCHWCTPTSRVDVQSQKALGLIAKMSSILLQIEVSPQCKADTSALGLTLLCPSSLTTAQLCRHWQTTANSWTCPPWLPQCRSWACLCQHRTTSESHTHISSFPNKATPTLSCSVFQASVETPLRYIQAGLNPADSLHSFTVSDLSGPTMTAVNLTPH